ncbi:hypothetical protein CDAR_588121 [Caerostris darwini]|uniref:DUF5641 domain-containing protein n=1 Tax=Caerostris darwini TaxID=1538125 RepID=A0AAV4SUS8_9ARAC|nr:hypothetical protein CDAR_588121 [Caerostris darwini]
MKSSIPLLLLSICWIASFGNCDISYRVIRKNHNNGKQNQEEEQCMDEMRKACGASECCRKLFQLDESHAKRNATEQVTEEEEDEDEMESGSSPSSDDYPGKKGKHLISEDDPEFGVVKQKRKAQGNRRVLLKISLHAHWGLQWLLGRVQEFYPGEKGIIRPEKLRTEKENILRSIQRLYPLELTPNYEQVVPETQKVSEVVTEYPELNTVSNETGPVSRSGREINQLKYKIYNLLNKILNFKTLISICISIS